MHLSNNTLLQGGKYRIVRFISAGGFGCTYEGVHTMMDTRVVIKEFFVKDFCNRDEQTSSVSVATQSKRELVMRLRRKFVDEARAVFRMQHPNIVRVTDVFEENGTAYYVMDNIEGSSLNEIVKQRGALPEEEAIGYIRQVCDALKYVHSKNRLHLDIKPGNIMLDKDGKAILIDFGASKHYDEESGENTSTLLGVNTKGYAPVEQSMQSFTTFSPATDIYALGATLYKLLTGITPPESVALMSEIETLKPLPSYVSVSVRVAIMSAMQVKREGRPQSVGEFVRLLSDKVDEKNILEFDETIIEDNQETKERPEIIVENHPKKKLTLIMVPIVVIAVCLFVVLFIMNYNLSYIDSTMQETSSVSQTIENKQITNKNGVSFVYSGEVHNGIPHGQGKGIYSNGVYEGTYREGLREGENCMFRTTSGDNCYIGSFKDDFYNEGKLTTNEGYYFVGKFKSGQPYNGLWYDEQGNEYSKITNGN